MALKLNVTIPELAINAPEAYIRINKLEVARVGTGKIAKIRVAYYASKDYADSKPIKSPEYSTDLLNYPAGDNPLAQAYNYLKTLPEFVGSIDV